MIDFTPRNRCIDPCHALWVSWSTIWDVSEDERVTNKSNSIIILNYHFYDHSGLPLLLLSYTSGSFNLENNREWITICNCKRRGKNSDMIQHSHSKYNSIARLRYFIPGTSSSNDTIGVNVMLITSGDVSTVLAHFSWLCSRSSPPLLRKITVTSCSRAIPIIVHVQFTD